MRYLITGGSGYIGTRLVDRLSRREDTESIVICDVAVAAHLRPEDRVPEDRRARPAGRSRRGRGGAARRARAPGVHPQPLARRGLHVRRGRERHAQRARGGRGGRGGPGAGDHVGGGVRRLPGQPGAAHRGRSRPRRRALLLRARQDRVRPHLPALGARASGPGAHHRAALHRVRPERGQLPGAPLDQDVRSRPTWARSTSRSSSSTRTTWSRP